MSDDISNGNADNDIYSQPLPPTENGRMITSDRYFERVKRVRNGKGVEIHFKCLLARLSRGCQDIIAKWSVSLRYCT